MWIARLWLLIAGMLWVMCWSRRSANGQGVGLTLNGMSLTNNSIVTNTDIGTGAAALVCTTTYTPCCSSFNNPETQWYFPNGTQVQNILSLPYRRTRGRFPGRVTLNRNSESTITGIFHCDIPDVSGVTQSLYVGIYTSTTGKPTATTLLYNETTKSLTCTSTGGPATTVTWRKDGAMITIDGTTYKQTKVVTDPVTGSYESVLIIDQGTPNVFGIYSCTVGNARGTSAAIAATGASPPTNLSAQPTSPTSIKVSWTPPASGPTVVGYRIYYVAEGSQDNHTDPSSVDVGASTTQHTLSGLQGGIWYTITMVTKSQYLPSTVAGPVIVTYTMVRVKVVNATALLVSWDALRNAHHYTIYYSAFSPELFKVVEELTIVVPSTKTADIVVIRELAAGLEHQFQVTASLVVQGEMYESRKSFLTKIVIDEAAFHLQMGRVSPCTTWSTEKAEEIRSYVHSGIAKAISYHCNCSFPVSFIRNGLFRCWKADDEFAYRSVIVGTEAHNATELVEFLEEWVNSEPTLQVDQFELWVDTQCPVLIPSLKLRGEDRCS